MPDSPDKSRADASDLSSGDKVTWGPSNARRYGEVASVETSGTHEPEGVDGGPSMEASEDEPVVRIDHFEPSDDGWEETDVLTVHRADNLEKIDSFPERSMRATGSYRAVLPGTNIRDTPQEDIVTVQFMTEEVARDGMVLDADGLDTSAFEENPVVLWSHGTDPRRGDEPIARATGIRRNDNGMLADVTFAEDDFAQRIKRKVQNGFVNAVSIGWRTEEMDQAGEAPTVTRSDMTEFSFVAVPADTQALVQERTAGSEVEGKIERLEQKIEQMQTSTRGDSLASTLEGAIEEMTGEDTSSQDIQDEMASAAGISPATVDGILSGEINCPPLNRLEGFADALGVNLDTLVSSAENDGCEYDRSDCNCNKRAEATATSPCSDTDAEGTRSASVNEDRDDAQERTRYVRLSELRKLREERKQETRKTIRTQLKQILGMA